MDGGSDKYTTKGFIRVLSGFYQGFNRELHGWQQGRSRVTRYRNDIGLIQDSYAMDTAAIGKVRRIR